MRQESCLTASRHLISLAAIALSACVGCASGTRYAVLTPSAAGGPVARNAGAIVARDGVDYELFQVEDRLVLRFVNRTNGPLALTETSVMIDASGRRFGVEPQDLPPDGSGRVVIPPTGAAERTRTTPVVAEVRVGGVDEGGLIGTRRDLETNTSGLNSGAAAAPAPGFRWRPGQVARVRLVLRPGNPTTAPGTSPSTSPTVDADGTLTHEWTLRREG